MAEGVFRKMLAERGLEEQVLVDSAATHEFHEGKPPFAAACSTAKQRGYAIDHLVSRKVRPTDFDTFDCIVAMDGTNLGSLRAIAPTRCKHKIELLTEYSEKFHGKEIRDPYGGKPKDYEAALDMIEDGCRGLVDLLVQTSKQRSVPK